MGLNYADPPKRSCAHQRDHDVGSQGNDLQYWEDLAGETALHFSSATRCICEMLEMQNGPESELG